jgi:hypothetical protein
MKKKILITSGILLVILLAIFLYFNNNSKFHLESKYYGNSNFIKANKKSINKLETNKESCIVYTYNAYCNLKIPCETIFKNFMTKYNISFYSVPFDEMKESYLYKKVKYAPSVIIIKNGKVIAYLDADKNADLAKYQDDEAFKNWISKYIYLS